MRNLDDIEQLLAGFRTDTVVAIALEYIRRSGTAPILVDMTEHQYQIKRLLSDALRDAGCDDEGVHEWVLVGGLAYYFSKIITRRDVTGTTPTTRGP